MDVYTISLIIQYYALISATSTLNTRILLNGLLKALVLSRQTII